MKKLGASLTSDPKPIIFHLYYSECGLCGEEVENTLDGKTVTSLRTVQKGKGVEQNIGQAKARYKKACEFGEKDTFLELEHL